MALQFREVRRRKNRLKPTGRLSPVYGGVWDRRRPNGKGGIGSYDPDREPEKVVTLDVAPRQFDTLIDDDPFHIVLLGSRRAMKTETLVRWLLKKIVEWPGHQLPLMVRKRKVARKVLKKKLIPIVPPTWVRKIRVSNDETAVEFINGVYLDFLTGGVEGDARGDGSPAGAVDETQKIPREAVGNLLASMSEGGSRFQTLETCTALSGEFEEYWEKAQKSKRYRTETFSITDNVFLETVFDEQTGVELPEFIVSCREIFDIKTFEQEIGKWSAKQKRYIPQFVQQTGLVYWALRKGRHAREYSQDTAAEVVAAIVGCKPSQVTDKTKRVCGSDWLVGADFTPEPTTAAVLKVFSVPNHPDVVWCVDEVALDAEDNGERLGLELSGSGYANATVVPDAAGRKTKQGPSNTRMISSLGFKIAGPMINPDDRDMVNAINGKLGNANRQTSLIIDSTRAKRTFAAMQAQRNGANHKPKTLEGEEHFVRALGYPINHYYPAAVKTRRLQVLTANG